jgi:hypothetical protein
VVSLGLVIAAAWIAAQQRGTAIDVLKRLQDASPSLVVLLLTLPLVSTGLTAAAFWQTSRRYGSVRFTEMLALVGSSWVLNLLPLKPGLVGRVGYHARYNGIGVKQSMLMLVEVSCAGVIGVGAALVLTLCLHEPSAARVVIAASVWSVLVVGAGVGAVKPRNAAACVLTTSLIRAADAGVWTLRYWLILRLVGLEGSIVDAALIATAAQAAMYVPLVGNGLGVREWAVGATASLRQQGGGLSADVFTRAMPAGLSIDLVNRVAELVALVPVGLVCCAWVARLVGRHEAELKATSPSR